MKHISLFLFTGIIWCSENSCQQKPSRLFSTLTTEEITTIDELCPPDGRQDKIINTALSLKKLFDKIPDKEWHNVYKNRSLCAQIARYGQKTLAHYCIQRGLPQSKTERADLCRASYRAIYAGNVDIAELFMSHMTSEELTSVLEETNDSDILISHKKINLLKRNQTTLLKNIILNHRVDDTDPQNTSQCLAILVARNLPDDYMALADEDGDTALHDLMGLSDEKRELFDILLPSLSPANRGLPNKEKKTPLHLALSMTILYGSTWLSRLLPFLTVEQHQPLHDKITHCIGLPYRQISSSHAFLHIIHALTRDHLLPHKAALMQLESSDDFPIAPLLKEKGL